MAAAARLAAATASVRAASRLRGPLLPAVAATLTAELRAKMRQQPMPSSPSMSANEEENRKPILETMRKASQEGAAWARAEAALAQAELAEATRRAMMAVALAILAGAAALAALVVTSLGIVALLVPVAGSAIAATAIVGGILILCTVLLTWWAWRLAVSTTDATTFIERWLDMLFSKRQRRS
jgi:Putative Actinobacterial Holin-X, holin superfamily III